MRTDELDFEVPPELIAQVPPEQRGSSRLLCYRRADRSVAHRRFEDLPRILRRGDLLVFNDARVIPARFLLKRSTGGLVEALFLAQRSPRRWEVLLKNAPAAGGVLHFVNMPQLDATIIEHGGEGRHVIELSAEAAAIELLKQLGRMPLPPYIKREKRGDPRDPLDRKRYQTIYAAADGSIAAPTAGLHFTPQLVGELESAGVKRAMVTLDVSLGTFKPVTAERIEDHAMHAERYRVSAEAADALNAAKREKRRIIAVGTTSARVLESQLADAPFVAKTDSTSILIHPPYEWRHVNSLITNFHLPRSTLIALVAAMIGLHEQRRIYQIAIEERYRFFSYGDAMLIE